MRHLLAYAFALLPGLHAGTAAAEGQPLGIQSYTGMCEASAAVAVTPDRFAGGLFAVANDEDNVLRVYKAGEPAVHSSLDLNRDLGTKEKDKADIEGAAWLDDRIYWIASHSRSGKGKPREERQQVFATRLKTNGDRTELEFVGKTVSLLYALREALGPFPPDGVNPLKLSDPLGFEDKDVKELAPERDGLNIEALATGPGETLLIGLRNPLAGGRAIVIPFINPRAATEGAALPKLGVPMTLELGGRGIRSMEYSAKRNLYFIVAGPVDDAEELSKEMTHAFELYSWSGKASSDLIRVPAFGQALADPRTFQTGLLAAFVNFHPEAMILDLDGERVWLFSDDGDLQVNGTKCSDQKSNLALKQFRSVHFQLSQ